MKIPWKRKIRKGLFWIGWLLVMLSFYYLIHKNILPKQALIHIALLVLITWRIFSKLTILFTYPPSKKGNKKRFKQCLKILRMEEARDMALRMDEPYKTRMLRLAWKRLAQKADKIGYHRTCFLWLDKLDPDLREAVAPRAYQKHGGILVKNSINHLTESINYRTHVDWEIVEKIGYKLSRSELKKAAKFGEQKAIEQLGQKRVSRLKNLNQQIFKKNKKTEAAV